MEYNGPPESQAFQCEVCWKCCKAASDLDQHLWTLSGQRGHPVYAGKKDEEEANCPTCVHSSKWFKTEQGLQGHLYTLSGAMGHPVYKDPEVKPAPKNTLNSFSDEALAKRMAGKPVTGKASGTAAGPTQMQKPPERRSHLENEGDFSFLDEFGQFAYGNFDAASSSGGAKASSDVPAPVKAAPAPAAISAPATAAKTSSVSPVMSPPPKKEASGKDGATKGKGDSEGKGDSKGKGKSKRDEEFPALSKEQWEPRPGRFNKKGPLVIHQQKAQEDIEMDGDEGQQDEPARPQGPPVQPQRSPVQPQVPYAPTVVISGPAAAELIAKNLITVKAFPGGPAVGTPTVGTPGNVDGSQRPISPVKATGTPAATAKASEATAGPASVVVVPKAAVPVVPALPKAPVPPLPSAPSAASSTIPSLPTAPVPNASGKDQEDLLDPDEDVEMEMQPEAEAEDEEAEEEE